MSVINKMLRDLDQRRASTLDPALRSGTTTASIRTVVLPVRSTRLSLWWTAGGAGLAMLAALAWWVAAQPVSGPAASDVVPAPEPLRSPVAAEMPMAVPAPPAAPASSTPVNAAVASATNPPVVKQELAPSPAPVAAPAPAKPAQVAAAELKLLPATPGPATLMPPPPVAAAVPAKQPVSSAVVTSNSVPESAVVAQRQQNATRDVLAQAQALYNSGSADAAIQLLQDSLLTAERASPPAAASTLLPLVRELARMELAQGRASAVLELLGRLEPLIAGQPDLWAVRANAAQRLGRHQEAIQYYTSALQSRPSEQRWLLGSAVSHAALGQLVIAADLADKARAIAPVSKEVLTYLRQQGVAISDRP